MATKAVLYKLKSDGGQPYKALEQHNLVFDGGICEKNGVYLGLVKGTIADMQKFAAAVENLFDFKVITKDEAITFYTSCLPDVIKYPPQPTKQDLISDLSAKIP